MILRGTMDEKIHFAYQVTILFDISQSLLFLLINPFFHAILRNLIDVRSSENTQIKKGAHIPHDAWLFN